MKKILIVIFVLSLFLLSGCSVSDKFQNIQDELDTEGIAGSSETSGGDKLTGAFTWKDLINFKSERSQTLEKVIDEYPIGSGCEDTDEGKDLFVNGIVYQEGIGYEDSCSSYTQVVEYYCEDDKAKVMNSVDDSLSSSGIYCPKGYYCSSGACIEDEQGLVEEGCLDCEECEPCLCEEKGLSCEEGKPVSFTQGNTYCEAGHSFKFLEVNGNNVLLNIDGMPYTAELDNNFDVDKTIYGDNFVLCLKKLSTASGNSIQASLDYFETESCADSYPTFARYIPHLPVGVADYKITYEAFANEGCEVLIDIDNEKYILGEGQQLTKEDLKICIDQIYPDYGYIVQANL